MVAHDIDDRGPGPTGIVEVGEAIGETQPGVEQGRGRLVGHSAVTIGRRRHHALEQAEHATHLRPAVERRHEMHLGRAGIGKAEIDAVTEQRVAENVRSVHAPAPRHGRPSSACLDNAGGRLSATPVANFRAATSPLRSAIWTQMLRGPSQEREQW